MARAAILSVYVAFLGTMFLLPQYLQYVHDRSVLTAGLLLTPLGIGAGVMARYNARVAAAFGARVTIAAGLVALAASTALLAAALRDDLGRAGDGRSRADRRADLALRRRPRRR